MQRVSAEQDTGFKSNRARNRIVRRRRVNIRVRSLDGSGVSSVHVSGKYPGIRSGRIGGKEGGREGTGGGEGGGGRS